MAATSTLPAHKRRKQVYGKPAKQSKWNVDSFFDDNDLPSPDSLRNEPQHPSFRDEVKVPDITTAPSQSSRPAPKRHDTFDIPSSDDDQSFSYPRLVAPSKFRQRATLFDDTNLDVAQLAPWERERMECEQERTPEKASRASSVSSPDAQLQQDLIRALSSGQPLKGNSPSPSGKSATKSAKEPASHERNTSHSPARPSAMARLAARRQDKVLPVVKRSAFAHDAADNDYPRKRVRASPASGQSMHSSPGDRSSEHASIEPVAKAATNNSDAALNVFDIPESSEDEQLHQSPSTSNIKSSAGKVATKGKLKTYTSRTTAQIGSPASARLPGHITDDDFTETPPRSPAASSRYSTPHLLPSTPSRGSDEKRHVAPKESGTMTPKQSQLWHELLRSDATASSPSVLPIKDLAITHMRQSSVSPFDRKPAKSRSNTTRRRTRLVDRLKASASSENLTIIEQDGEEEKAATSERHVLNQLEAAPSTERPALPKRMSSQLQASQRQVAAIGQNGPKITYAQSRSYLQEENTEQDLMISLANDSTQSLSQNQRNGKGMVSSQHSSYDLDDSGDENRGSGNIRTIHELRAAGRSVSGLYDTEELLGEIQNHSPSHRGRRRSALLELAIKLLDKTFATRFTAQSLEVELAEECGVNSDAVADFLLATALLLILVSEPPQHTVQSFKQQQVVPWLARLLDETTEVSKLAKSRQNNMAKAAQTSLIDFSQLLEKHTSLWSTGVPEPLTSRFVALKVLDLLVGKLRRSGDRSELLLEEHIIKVLPSEVQLSRLEDQGEADLVISLLESLSTSTASLSWPTDILRSLGKLLPQLEVESATQSHTVFLTLRLCLNLTNGDIQNCAILSETPNVVRHLLGNILQGFSALSAPESSNEQARALALDRLVLSMGILINLTEQHDGARQHALQETDTLSSLITTFQHGQQHMLDAESVEESVTNVTFGYLAVVLANLCQNQTARRFIAEELPGKNLGTLVEAVEEFVTHHARVDMMNFEGEEGAGVWSAFTEKLKQVLARLKEGQA